MIKFNELMSYDEIRYAYKKNKFPNAYCLLVNGIHGVRLLSTPNDEFVVQENKKGVEVE